MIASLAYCCPVRLNRPRVTLTAHQKLISVRKSRIPRARLISAVLTWSHIKSPQCSSSVSGVRGQKSTGRLQQSRNPMRSGGLCLVRLSFAYFPCCVKQFALPWRDACPVLYCTVRYCACFSPVYLMDLASPLHGIQPGTAIFSLAHTVYIRCTGKGISSSGTSLSVVKLGDTVAHWRRTVSQR